MFQICITHSTDYYQQLHLCCAVSHKLSLVDRFHKLGFHLRSFSLLFSSLACRLHNLWWWEILQLGRFHSEELLPRRGHCCCCWQNFLCCYCYLLLFNNICWIVIVGTNMVFVPLVMLLELSLPGQIGWPQTNLSQLVHLIPSIFCMFVIVWKN